MGAGSRKRIIVVAAAVAVGSALTAVALPSESAPAVEAQGVDPCVGGGLRNSGFEAGLVGGNPKCWTVVTPVKDRVRVVGTEGPSYSAVYAEKKITVVPPVGTSMLALGNPKQQGESQAKNPDIVKQTFTATATAIDLQVRIFSWEPNGDDIVKVSINGGATASLKLEDTPKYTNGSCSLGACSFSIDTGSRNDKRLLDTNWRTAKLAGLVPGKQYTLEITIGGTKSTSFATWGYVDNVNSPPVARFDLDRPDDCSFAPFGKLYEGQPIPLNDCSYDPDGQIVERKWEITFPGTDSAGKPLVATTTATSGFIYPDDEGAYVVKLTVTDNDGQTATVTVGSGGQACSLTAPGTSATSPGVRASDGTCLPALIVENAPPLVDAVDVQAVAGSDVDVVARYGDAGIWDDHTVTVGSAAAVRGSDGCRSAAVSATAPCFDEDNLPAVETGIVKGKTVAPSTPGTSSTVAVSVTDKARVGSTQPAASSTTTEVAKITAIPNDPRQFEPAPGATDLSRPVTLGARYADWIDQPGDIDLFRVEWPGSDGNKPLPVGTELLVSLRDLPADYDVAVLVGRSGGTAPGQISPGQISPGQISPGQISPGQISPGQISPGQISPGQISPGQISPGQISPGQISPGQISPGQISTLQRAPGQISPGQISPGQISPGQISPGQISSLYDLLGAGNLSPYVVNPFQLYPLSLRAYTNVSGTNLSGTDVDIDELGLGELATDLRVAGYSANRGLDADNVLVRIDEPQTKVYVVVIGANNQFSNVSPYALQIEGSAPFDSTVLAAGKFDSTKLQLFGGTCARTFRGGNGTSSVTQVSANRNGTSDTLFVTSKDRLSWVDPSSTEIAWPKIAQLAGTVGGSILDVRSSAFAAWDAATCDPSAANAVADAVRDAVQAELKQGGYEYVVVVGGDDVIPFRRVVDETTYANETQYVSSSFLAPGQPLFASKAGGFNLTDAHLTDAVPTPWRGRSLWVGDLPTSRLVETETEIAAQVDAYRNSGGVVDLGRTAVVTGSEFFDDGAEAVASALQGGGATVERIIDPATAPAADLSTADDYLCSVFGVSSACTRTSDQPSPSVAINDINAHYLHFATFSPKGSATADPSQVIGSTAVAQGAAGSGIAAGSFYLTIGCHGGLAVPDDEVQVDQVAPGLRASLDWPQALAQRQAVMIGNTGFGLGEDAGIAYTEQLHQYLAEELLKQPTVGDALVAAQQRYLTTITQFDEYHEKTLIQTTMYGLAFYKLPAAQQGFASTAALIESPVAQQSAPTPAGTIGATVDGATLTAALGLVEDARGKYYVADEVLATVERPKQPLIVRDIATPAGGAPAHGVLIRHSGTTSSGSAGAYTDQAGFDPVIHTPNSEWLSGGGEPQVCLDAWWPSTLAQVNTQELGGGQLRQTLSIKPGQFRCDSGPAATVTGTQRLFNGLPLQLLRSSLPDWKAPVIRQVDFEAGETPNSLAVTMQLDTNVDLRQIVLLRLLGGNITSQDVTNFVKDVDGTTVTFQISALQPDEGYLIQLADTAGNVTTYTGKSTVPSVIDIEASGPSWVVPGAPTTLRVTIPDYVNDVADGSLVEEVWFSWDFGAPVLFEGRPVSQMSALVEPGITPGTNIVFNADGDAVIDVTVVYDESAPYPTLATARVVDSDGGIGVDRLTLRPGCDTANLPDLPDADLVGCGIDFGAVTGTGDPAVGFTVGVVGVISPDYQYRIGFDTDGNGGVDKTVKYSNGKLTGPVDATAVLNETGDELIITVPLDDIVTACPDDPTKQCVIWQYETQAGIAGGPGQGFLDKARDELTVTELPSA